MGGRCVGQSRSKYRIYRRPDRTTGSDDNTLLRRGVLSLYSLIKLLYNVDGGVTGEATYRLESSGHLSYRVVVGLFFFIYPFHLMALNDK